MAWASAQDKNSPPSGTWAPCALLFSSTARMFRFRENRRSRHPDPRGAKAETGGQEDMVIRVLEPASVLPLPRGGQEPKSLPIQLA
jgi:hypothetical protein